MLVLGIRYGVATEAVQAAIFRSCAGAACAAFQFQGRSSRKLMAFGLAGDDALQDIGEPGLRVYIVEQCGVDERGENCPGVRAVFAAREEAVAPAEADGAHVALHGVVVHLDAAIGEEHGEPGQCLSV